MKTLTTTLFVAFGLTLGACGTTGHSVTGNGSPTGGVSNTSASGSSQREYARASDNDVDREPQSFARTDRGIPTPQPARDPAAMAGPVPQPPIPADPHRDTSGYNPHARY
jgi:hypothetical protein